jgi:lipoate-protein ligase B
VADLGRTSYLGAWSLQRTVCSARQGGRIPDVILLTEHEPVFTLGRRGGKDHLLVPETFLETRNIPCVTTERGGDVTYHAPGQLVGYPVLRIPGGSRQVRLYVHTLEEVILRTLAGFGIPGERNEGHPGVWAHGEKIAFIGLAVERGVCFHGFALNVDPDLAPFSWMHPCGLETTTVTSMKALLKAPPAMPRVKQAVLESFCALLGYDPLPVSADALLPPDP